MPPISWNSPGNTLNEQRKREMEADRLRLLQGGQAPDNVVTHALDALGNRIGSAARSISHFDPWASLRRLGLDVVDTVVPGARFVDDARRVAPPSAGGPVYQASGPTPRTFETPNRPGGYVPPGAQPPMAVSHTTTMPRPMASHGDTTRPYAIEGTAAAPKFTQKPVAKTPAPTPASLVRHTRVAVPSTEEYAGNDQDSVVKAFPTLEDMGGPGEYGGVKPYDYEADMGTDTDYAPGWDVEALPTDARAYPMDFGELHSDPLQAPHRNRLSAAGHAIANVLRHMR